MNCLNCVTILFLIAFRYFAYFVRFIPLDFNDYAHKQLTLYKFVVTLILNS